MERQGTQEETVTLLVGHQNQDANDMGGGEQMAMSSPVTLVLLLSLIVVLCGAFTFGCGAGYSSPVQFEIMKDLDLSSAQYSVFASMPTIGAMISATVSGKIADLIGRRASLWFTQVLYIMGWLAIAFAKDAWFLDLGRLSIGFANGISFFAGPVYIAEIMPKNLRGTFNAMVQLMLSCGISLMYFIGTVIHWRTLALIGSIPCFIPLIGLFFVPESPRWLGKNGKEKELEAALQRLRGATANISREAAEIRDNTETFDQLSESRFFNLFQRRYTHALIVGVGLMFLIQFGGSSSVVAYASYIFVSAGFSSTVGSIGMAIVQIPATFFAIILVDKSGRRPILMVCAAGMCLSCFLVGMSFFLQYLNWWKEVSPILVFIGIMAYSVSVGGGMLSIPMLLVAEIFPINVKGSAGSLISLVNWFCSWVTVYTFTFMMEWSSTGTFFLFSIICGMIVIFVAKLVPETKGRTLEEIQSSLTHFLN